MLALLELLYGSSIAGLGLFYVLDLDRVDPRNQVESEAKSPTIIILDKEFLRNLQSFDYFLAIAVTNFTFLVLEIFQHEEGSQAPEISLEVQAYRQLCDLVWI